MNRLFAQHDAAWRDPAQVVSHWRDADRLDPRALEQRARGAWWETLAGVGGTLVVTREYEHLVLALRMDGSRPAVSYLPLPHPSGLAFDEPRGVLHIASTRNPNELYDLRPVTGVIQRTDARAPDGPARLLVPTRTRFLPGSTYLHDLAMVGRRLHGNAVGQNAVIRIDDAGHEPVWWPRAIEAADGPVFGRNHIQLNSIAAGRDLRSSFFSASSDRITSRRPGHRDYPVDRRGVIFSGRTREPICRGLTRPHSARLSGGRVWVDNSGYGEVGVVRDGALEVVTKLPGWTRGLCLVGDVAFVGTSRVLPRFHRYAPGLRVDSSRCGLHALDVRSGRVLGSLTWPFGNQVFAIEWVPEGFTSGLPFTRRRRTKETRALFYAFETDERKGKR